MTERLAPPFQVRTSGHIDRWANHSTPGTRQDDVMLTAFLAGKGTYRNSTCEILVGEGMVGLVPPEDPGILMADAHDPYLHFFCRFNGAYALQLARGIIERAGCRFFRSAETERVADCIRRMGNIYARDLPDSMRKMELLLAEALLLLSARPAEQYTRITEAALIEYLRLHIAEPTNLDKMAEHFAVSRASLCRKARAVLGGTILQHHERLKMEWAVTLMNMQTLNITEVALRVGYRDPFYFSRVFRKHYKMSPKQWVMVRRRARPE